MGAFGAQRSAAGRGSKVNPGISELILKAFRTQTWPRGREWLPNLQAHRGFCLEGARENTLASLAQAQHKKFEMAEIDVRLSLDGIAVLAHDQTLKRLVGINKKVKLMTAKELAQYEFPTLEEVLKTKKRPAKINIEIKNDDSLHLKLENKIIEVIQTSQKSEDVMVSSFNPFSLKPFADNIPSVPRALLIDYDSFDKLNYLRLAGSWVARPNMVNWPQRLLNRELVQFLKTAGVPVAVWTVNDHDNAQKLYSWGVDSVITDKILPGSFS